MAGWLAVGVCVMVLSSSLAGAADTSAAPPEAVEQDCRYQTGGRDAAASASETWTNMAFLDGDVFRPLLAVPKEPQFFAQKIETVGVGLYLSF